MNLKKIKEGCSYFASPVNIGYVQKNETGLLIDAGIDASVSKKAVKQLKEKGLPLTDVLITHAHTDHFGGAGWIAENEQVRVWLSLLKDKCWNSQSLSLYIYFRETNLQRK
ncbi:MBL fold metallo-hydrolase [Thalassobacillus sp. C254]|uniref:MBL fold metallo-hydrolase n=1 Tax=Thalassobacillus sp. C254 TaxID=1225341 RepID=UPI0006D26402|nr:MBL fold metallo-hydrolase [Thalassobacillus sp. C254]